MNRADPFFERDATGWQFVDTASGRVSMQYTLYDNTARTVAFDARTGRPEDTTHQDPKLRIPRRHTSEVT